MIMHFSIVDSIPDSGAVRKGVFLGLALCETLLLWPAPQARADSLSPESFDTAPLETHDYLADRYVSTPENLPVENSAEVNTMAGEAPVRLAAITPEKPPLPKAVEESSKDSTRDYQLRKAVRERGFSLGYGRRFPISSLSERTDVSLFQFTPRWGRMHDKRQEWSWEIPLTYASEPGSAWAAGVSLMYRYHFSSNRRLAPFIEAGSGFVLTNLDNKIPELGDHFQFATQAGTGVRAALSRNSDLIYSVRWYHLSNAGIDSPNIGLNNYIVALGYSRVY